MDAYGLLMPPFLSALLDPKGNFDLYSAAKHPKNWTAAIDAFLGNNLVKRLLPLLAAMISCC
jgi:hypothetical protein